MKIDHVKFQALVKQLYKTVNKLEDMFNTKDMKKNRHFTPDGHMVGSLGECLVADAYGLTLEAASNKGFDAITDLGRDVEIKATQGKAVAFRSEPEHAIVIKILKDGTFEEIFNGPGSVVWKEIGNRPLPSNGQYQISLAKLRTLNEDLTPSDRVPRIPEN